MKSLKDDSDLLVFARYEPVIESLVFSERPAGYCLGFRGEDYSARIPRVQQY